MELLFLALLILLMAWALGSGFPVAFALPGSAIVTIAIAALAGYLFAGHTDAFFAQGGPEQWLRAGVTNLRGIYWEVERDTLIAIPLFIFMGIMLQRSKIAEDLLVTMAQLFGPVPGGLGISVVFVGALLAATTGIVGATVVAMGLISLPAMLRNNYSKPLATGTIAASGTLGQIIPPSIVLIILADQLASAVDQASTTRKALYKSTTGELSMPSSFDVVSTSAGEMFLGALVPGLVLVGLYMLFILIYALIRPSVAPAVHNESGFNRDFYKRLFLALVPPLALIFLVLGSIITGIATVNQAGAIGAAGALLMAGYRLTDGQKHSYTPSIIALVSVAVILFTISNFNTNVRAIGADANVLAIAVATVASVALVIALVWSAWRTYVLDDTLRGVMVETAKTTSLVFIILLGAAMLTAAFRAFGGEDLVREFLNSMPGGFWMKFLIVMMVIFILGFFLDFIEIAVVVVPIVSPILLADPQANITAVWLGVMIGLNIQTSFLTPPFGFALFYLRGVAPMSVRTLDIYKGVVPFISLQLIALVIVGGFPPLVNYLPTRVSLLSETAPPPRNPRLQYCVEEYVFNALDESGAKIKASVAKLRELDTSYIPKDMAGNLSKALDGAEESFALIEDVRTAEAAVREAAGQYAPLHDEVRAIQRDAGRIDEDIEALKTTLRRLRGDDETTASRREKLEARIAGLEKERDDLLATVPGSWEESHTAFAKLTKAEENARNVFRRTVDGAYEPVLELVAVLEATEAYGELSGQLTGLRTVVVSGDPAAVQEAIKQVEGAFGDVEGAGDVRSALSKVRRLFSRGEPDRADASAQLEDAIAAYEEDLAWRKRASAELLPAVVAYEADIRGTIGLRQLQKFPREQALSVARCSSSHRNLSLSF